MVKSNTNEIKKYEPIITTDDFGERFRSYFEHLKNDNSKEIYESKELENLVLDKCFLAILFESLEMENFKAINAEKLMHILVVKIPFETVVEEFLKSNSVNTNIEDRMLEFINLYFTSNLENPSYLNQKLAYMLSLNNKKVVKLIYLLFYVVNNNGHLFNSFKQHIGDKSKILVRENTLNENQINMITLSEETKKLINSLDDKLNIKFSSTDKTGLLSDISSVETFINKKQYSNEELLKEKLKNNLLNESLKINELIKVTQTKSVHEKLELIITIDNFISKNNPSIDLFNLNKVKIHLTNHKNKIVSALKCIFDENFENIFCKIVDKQIILNKIKEDSNSYSDINLITANYPNFMIENFQQLYDNFITYSHNSNYILMSDHKEDNSETYSLNLIDEVELLDNIIDTRLNSFSDTVNIITKFVYSLEKLITQTLKIKDYVDSPNTNESYLIKHEMFYKGSPKKSKNNFIFVLCNHLHYKYLNFKELVLEKLDTKHTDKERVTNLKNCLLKFQDLCNKIKTTFSTVQNFKFFDKEDFNLNEICNIETSHNENDNLREQFDFKDCLFNLRDIIKQSYVEAKELKIEQFKYIELLSNLMKLDFDVNEYNNLQSLDELNLNSSIIISKSFTEIITNIFEIESINKEQILNLISLLKTMYDSYFNQFDYNSEFSTFLILHNNVEALVTFLQMAHLLNYNNLQQKITSQHLKNVIVSFKNQSSAIVNQIISNFTRELIGELSIIESFEDVRFDRNLQQIEQTLKRSLEIIFKFFNLFKELASEKDLLYHLNCILSLFFDILNRKIFNVKDYNIDDTKVLIKTSKFITGEIKKNFETNLNNSYGLSNILENNVKYKKFEEVIFILNSSMKEIRSFIIQMNYTLHIDPLELVELIKSIFEDNPNRKNLVKFIDESIKIIDKY